MVQLQVSPPFNILGSREERVAHYIASICGADNASRFNLIQIGRGPAQAMIPTEAGWKFYNCFKIMRSSCSMDKRKINNFFWGWVCAFNLYQDKAQLTE